MFIDLSVLVNEQTPVYPGDPATKVTRTNTVQNNGFTDHSVTIGTHIGTHIDAPMHMLEAGASLEQAPLTQFIGQGCLVKVKDGDFTAVKQADIHRDDIVLLYSGTSEQYNNPHYFEDYPAMPVEIAEYLVEKQVKLVGTDTCSIDNQPHFPIHKSLLSHNILIIENLVNLSSLEGKRFIIYALPLKLNLDGAPARVIAQIID